MSTERKPHVGIRSIGHTEPDYRFPKITATRDGLSASFDLTPMVHDLTRQVLERGAVDEVITFLTENGHLADVILKAKAEALEEAADYAEQFTYDPEYGENSFIVVVDTRTRINHKLEEWLRNRAQQLTEES